jgi:hypothetical protein
MAVGSDAEFAGGLVWSIDDPDFGGFSGLEVSDDGMRFMAVSDRGKFIEGQFIRTEGRITDLEVGPLQPLRDRDSVPLAGRFFDAEGLAWRPDGGMYVSFEGNHRVWSYETPTSAAKSFRRHTDFKHLQNNSSLEALAIHPNGDVYTLPERSGELTRPFPLYRLRDGHWTKPFEIPRHGPYLAVGADFGPDGMFYLLERRLAGILGFQTRVRRFAFDIETGPGAEETIIETIVSRHDNLEGIGVWRDSAGAIRITMISDDNQRSFQRTEFVEYRLQDGVEPAATSD